MKIIKKLIIITTLICFCSQQVVWAGADRLRPVATANKVAAGDTEITPDSIEGAPIAVENIAEISEDEPEKLSIGAYLVIAVAVLLAIYVYWLGTPVLVKAIAGYQTSGIIGKVLRGAVIMMVGDLIGRPMADGVPHKPKDIINRAVIIFLAAIPMMLASFTLISGIDAAWPQQGLWSLQNLGRAFLMFITGAFTITSFYFFCIVPPLEKWVARKHNLPDLDKILDYYSFKRRFPMNYKAVKSRWAIVLPSYACLNLLPFWGVSRLEGLAIISAFNRIFVAFWASRKKEEKGERFPFLHAMKDSVSGLARSAHVGKKRKAAPEPEVNIPPTNESGPVAESLERDLSREVTQSFSLDNGVAIPMFPKPHVLILDNNPRAIKSARKHFAGWVIVEAQNITEAVRAVEEHPPFDIIISDLDLSNNALQKIKLIKVGPRRTFTVKAGETFAFWMVTHEKRPQRIILTSSIFERNGRDRLAAILVGHNPSTIERKAKVAGIIVLPKSSIRRGDADFLVHVDFNQRTKLSAFAKAA